MVTTRTPTARAHRRAARRPRTVPAAAAWTPTPSMPITVSPFTLTATSAPCTAACTTVRRAATSIPPILTPPSACVTNSNSRANNLLRVIPSRFLFILLTLHGDRYGDIPRVMYADEKQQQQRRRDAVHALPRFAPEKKCRSQQHA